MEFVISQIADWDKRLNESYKIRAYFEELIKREILGPYKIILKNGWTIDLTVHLVPETITGEIDIIKGNTYSNFKRKTFPVFIPLNKIKSSPNVVEAYIDYLFLAIKIFFISNYKKLNPEIFEELKKQIDYNYLISLPFPAPFIEQKYIGDDSGTVKKFLALE